MLLNNSIPGLSVLWRHDHIRTTQGLWLHNENVKALISSQLVQSFLYNF